MKQLFVIESPFQLLNAFEALNSFKAKKQAVLVRFSGENENDKQIKNSLTALKIGELAEIRYVYLTIKNRKPADILKLLYLKFAYFFKVLFYKKIFIGNYESRFMKFIIPYSKKIVLLDDGFKTITIQNKFSNKKNYKWFSIFDLDLFDNQKLIKNNYKYINERLKNKVNNSTRTILFIGSKLSEADVILESYNLKLIKNIAERYLKEEIIYVAHRGENESKLKLIEQINNIKVIKLDYPIELMPIYSDILPKEIVSFYSTALITLNEIYKVKTIAFKFNYNNSIYKKDIDTVYDYCQKYIDVINEENI